MNSATLAQPQNKMAGMKKWLLAAGLILLVAAAAGLLAWYYSANQSNLPPLVTQAEFEEVSGIRPRMIAVTAGGGIVDFRFKVIDGERAKEVLLDTTLFPRLIIEDTGRVLNAGTHHLNSFEAGNIYFMFYPNVDSVVETGTELSVLVGDTRYGPIVAK